jgi:hypothetical protein
MTTDLELLLARADDYQPLLPSQSLTLGAASAGPPAQQAYPDSLRYDSGDPNDLVLQRWGIVAPEGEVGDRLLALIKPLQEARREQQGGAEVIVYRVPPGMDAAKAVEWRDRVYLSEQTRERDRPRYLLVLGDLDQVPLELQHALGGDTFTGRLAFREDAGYEAYVAKVLRAERGTPTAQPRLLFFTAQDGSAATSIGYRALVAPSVALCQAECTQGVLNVGEVVPIPYDATPSATFLSAVTRPEPAILFSVSHGLGAPRGGWTSSDQQRALQGAMCLGTGVRIAGEDIAQRPFLPGGVWFFLACYGGAVPATSAYERWLRELKDAGAFPGRVESVLEGLPKPGERPFVSALPQAALANPDGPLAVMAHADLAWTYSFQDLGPNPMDRPSRFQGIFRSLADDARVGPAHHELLRYMVIATNDLVVNYSIETPGAAPDAARAIKRANLWMLRQDLGAYLLLGDPAVRLPVSGALSGSVPAQSAKTSTVAPTIAGPSVPAGPPSDSSAAALVERYKSLGIQGAPLASLKRDPARMEKAVKEVIRGVKGAIAIAEQYSVDPDDLQAWVEAYCNAGRAALAKLA